MVLLCPPSVPRFGPKCLLGRFSSLRATPTIQGIELTPAQVAEAKRHMAHGINTQGVGPAEATNLLELQVSAAEVSFSHSRAP